MNIGFFNCYKEYNKNRMFVDPSSPIGDNLMYPFFYLGKKLEQLGHKAQTIDTAPLESFDAIVFVEFPTFKNKYFRELVKKGFENLYLMAMESPIVRPDNLDPKNHKYFEKIFTWSDNLIDNKKYFRIDYAQKIPENLNFKTSKKQKLCTTLASNRTNHRPGELYTERAKAIRWFEKKSPARF